MAEKVLGLVSPTHFTYDFSGKMLHVISSQQVKFHYLIAFTSADIGQYVCVFQLLVNQAVTSENLKLTLSF